MVNDPEITGCSIPWNPTYRALTIVPHTPSSDLRCCSDYSEGTIWHHIPLRRGELLKEIWRRTCYSRLTEDVDLVMVTSDSNVYILGPHESSNRQYSYSRLATLRDSPNYLYMDDSVGSIREFAWDPDPSVGNHTWEDYRPQPLSSNPGERSNTWNISERFFYTSAWLTDLISINVCQFNEVVTGPLMYYEDGSVGSLGQVRLDRLQGERQVPSNATIRFTSLRTAQQCLYVSGVLVLTEQATRPPLNDGLDLEVKCQGIMEWWFTRRQCHLAYKNRTSAYLLVSSTYMVPVGHNCRFGGMFRLSKVCDAMD